MSRPLSSMGGRIPGTVGWDEAAALMRQMLDSRAPVHAGVTGPGGAGKSTLLDDLAGALRTEGMDVVRGFDDYGRAEVDPARVVLLVDDAEHLGDDDVAELTRLMRTDGPHVVVAFRPWPRSEAVAGLVDRLRRQRPHLVLQHLSMPDVRERAAELLGDPPADDAVGRVLHLTRGNPRYVDHVLLAVREEGWDLRDASPLPSTALERLRHRLDRLDPDLLDFLVALAVGFSVSGPALATAPRFANADLRALMAAARATGMVSPEGALLPIIRITVL